MHHRERLESLSLLCMDLRAICCRCIDGYAPRSSYATGGGVERAEQVDDYRARGGLGSFDGHAGAELACERLVAADEGDVGASTLQVRGWSGRRLHRAATSCRWRRGRRRRRGFEAISPVAWVQGEAGIWRPSARGATATCLRPHGVVRVPIRLLKAQAATLHPNIW